MTIPYRSNGDPLCYTPKCATACGAPQSPINTCPDICSNTRLQSTDSPCPAGVHRSLQVSKASKPCRLHIATICTGTHSLYSKVLLARDSCAGTVCLPLKLTTSTSDFRTVKSLVQGIKSQSAAKIHKQLTSLVRVCHVSAVLQSFGRLNKQETDWDFMV